MLHFKMRGYLTNFRMLLICAILMTHATSLPLDSSSDVGRIVSTVTDGRIDEASGLALSRRHPGIVYTHNDSGGRARVFALDVNTGQVVATLRLTGQGVYNCDWEDIAVGPANDEESDTYIYVGDIGGNSLFKCNVLYRVREPDVLSGDMDVAVNAKVSYSYGASDSETLMVDEVGIAWLVSKVNSPTHPRLFRVPPEAWSQTGVVDLGQGVEMQVSFFMQAPTGGDISADGRWIILKGYAEMLGFLREGNETLEDVLANTNGTRLPYLPEKQGEAVAWDPHATGYYTLSEGTQQSIWYYNNTMLFDNTSWISSDYFVSGGRSMSRHVFLPILTFLLWLYTWV